MPSFQKNISNNPKNIKHSMDSRISNKKGAHNHIHIMQPRDKSSDKFQRD
ncbi:hypothetical protein PIROE2DRAFT_8016 [Piromyces sp. E2]|nr:hypothetical protein PIROE2DRAFT_8016 [Piromyces sp. E2]|eukprot:OUM65039.1 hypothetical protein PIROE2DRAFT_8016 [Piromyces sp. E2]